STADQNGVVAGSTDDTPGSIYNRQRVVARAAVHRSDKISLNGVIAETTEQAAGVSGAQDGIVAGAAPHNGITATVGEVDGVVAGAAGDHITAVPNLDRAGPGPAMNCRLARVSEHGVVAGAGIDEARTTTINVNRVGPAAADDRVGAF